MKQIEITGTKLKSIFLLARLSWCLFKAKTSQNQEIELRFIELERKIDNFSKINEIILTHPELQETQVQVLKENKLEITFELEKTNYYFESTLKDFFQLYEHIPVISLQFPEKIYKEQLRQATRIKVPLPEQLLPEQIYLYDISVLGLAFFSTNQELTLKTNLNLTLQIPLLRQQNETLKIIYYTTNFEMLIIRQFENKKKQIYATQFHKITNLQFILLKKYLNIRLKEEEFFKKNQYYPQITLPNIQIY